MQLRDLPFDGLFKVLVVVNLLLPLLFLPLMAVVYLVNPDALHFSNSVNILGIGFAPDKFTWSYVPIYAVFFLLGGLITSMVQAVAVRVLARFTPVGNLKLARAPETEIFS